MTKSKSKIIYIMSHSPAYEMYKNESRPEINWDIPNGSWVGIWGYDWGDQLGNAVLAQTNDFEFEVWQPDLRADKIYEYKFKTGLVHKLFPAELKKTSSGKFTFSLPIIDTIKTERKSKNIFLHTGILVDFVRLILDEVGELPVLGSFHGNINLPIDNVLKIRKNPFRGFVEFRKHLEVKKTINRFDLITYQNDKNLHKLKSIYHGKLEKITMGVDFDEFRPLDKIGCRKELNLPLEKKIILSVGRLNSLKQNDKVIKTLNKLSRKYDFLYIIIGHGTEEYETYLKKLSVPLIEANKILYTGFVRGKELVKYYNAADLFLMTSKSEAGPVVSMEAMACGLPVFSTKTGFIAELLEKYRKGKIVGIKAYRDCVLHLANFLSGETIEILDRGIAKRYFSWSVVADKFIIIYKKAIKNHE